jgi:DNA invertase Pin-like site-specific DNA recombinase
MQNNDNTLSNQDDQQPTGRAVIYQRPGKSQVATTRPHQITDLLMFAREHGYTDITLFAEGFTPGSVATIEREMLQALLKSITNPDPDKQPIRAIFASSEDRLFRDPTGVDLTAFIETCRQHRVLLITPLGEYDFSKPVHAQLFRFKMQEAYQFVGQMITSRLQAGKRAAALRRNGGQQPSTNEGN